ncbi:MAG TPA: hypothetical protein VN455_04270 [Methanotrichaceae archaeon]|nr:hypothetical protein [Methanotrichaceae archaeon]
MTEIEQIGNSLRDLISDRSIIARCELLNRTYQFVHQANLSAEEKAELQKMVGQHIAAGIFNNILSGAPIFFDLPKLDTYTTINGRIFHFLHTQKYSKQDFDNAYRKFLSARGDLKDLLRQNLIDLLTEFMVGAGYTLVPSASSSDRLRFSAQGRQVDCLVFTSIKSVEPVKCTPEDGADCVVVVPSSESLEPFVQFFRENGAAADESGVQYWIANMEKGTIDPFIGYTTDMDIYEQFANPRLAEMVRTTWTARR